VYRNSDGACQIRRFYRGRCPAKMLFPKKGIVHPKKSIFPDAWANTRERAAFTIPTGETCMRCLPSGEEDGTCLLWESYRRAGAHPQDPLSARAVLPIDLLPFVYVLVRLDSTTFHPRPFSIHLSFQPPFSLPYAVCSSSSLVSADRTHTHPLRPTAVLQSLSWVRIMSNVRARIHTRGNVTPVFTTASVTLLQMIPLFDDWSLLSWTVTVYIHSLHAMKYLY